MRRRLRPLAHDERGSLLLEVVLATFLLAVGLLATLGVLSSSNHLDSTTQRQQALSTIAEQQMEQLRALSYSSLLMSSLPTHTTDGNATTDNSGNPTNPNYWVSGTNLLIEQNWNSESSAVLTGTASTGEAMASSSGGAVSPGPDSVSADGYTAKVYRYVTYVNEHCLYLLVDLCAGTQDAKRVTVAVILGSGGNGVTKPLWLSTVVAEPQAFINVS